jgi:hypothetical protein
LGLILLHEFKFFQVTHSATAGFYALMLLQDAAAASEFDNVRGVRLRFLLIGFCHQEIINMGWISGVT